MRAQAAGEQDVVEGEFEEMNGGSRGGGGGGAPLATVRQPQNGMRVATQYTTAIFCPVPRDPERVLKAVEREAALAGEEFMYSFSIGKGEGRTLIEGVSIDGAMILSRNWGNCVPEIEIVEDAPSHWIFRATFIDLETGSTLPRLFRQSKGAVHGKFDAERKLDMALQIGQSKAQRNVIVKAMPTYLVSAAVSRAKASAASKIVDLPKAIEHAVATFATKMQVTAEQLEALIGVPRAQWNANDIVRLRATYKAITERQTTVDQEFPKPGAGVSDDEPPAVVTPAQQAQAAAAQAQAAAQPMPAADTNMFTGEVSAPPVTAGAPPAAPVAPPAAPPMMPPPLNPDAPPALVPPPVPAPPPPVTAAAAAPVAVAAPEPAKTEAKVKKDAKPQREPGED